MTGFRAYFSKPLDTTPFSQARDSLERVSANYLLRMMGPLPIQHSICPAICLSFSVHAQCLSDSPELPDTIYDELLGYHY
jgi:hypothetical protein